MKKNDLAVRLRTEGFREDLYSLEGGFPPLLDGYILRSIGVSWVVEYYERGMTRTLADYASEEDACDGMYRLLSEDPTTRNHDKP